MSNGAKWVFTFMAAIAVSIIFPIDGSPAVHFLGALLVGAIIVELGDRSYRWYHGKAESS